ncbi:uncharacterized protein CkIIalpha-i3 isoform X3 [Drosophila kikkawai]|uniref:Uncharacterized protein CkIIalpha-i3 isoform X3 n=1 Tax=Drosophila kikkawai TaxID=30033 RepID=A0ABM4GGI4_DROKI
MPRKRRPNIGLRTRHAVQQKKYSQNLSEERKNMRKEYDRLRRSISSAKSTTEKEAPNVVENINKNISSPKPNTNTICLSKTVALISKENIDKRIKPTKDCKRCAFLQRSNKNNKDVPRVCNICLKWAHKVLQDGVEITPVRNVPINNTTASELAMAALKEHDYADSESTIKVEIEPVTEEEESLEEMDSPMPSVHVEIESLDDSMNDEIMSDIIKEEETETLSTTESIDFDKVTLIQDGLKSIDDKTTALAHVRILQEYAMLNDNYRAIGLLSEVEAALINPAKNEDFEC